MAITSNARGGEKNGDNKKKALGQAVGHIEKQFGKGAIMRLGADVSQRVPGISTGSLALDIAMGGTGFPRSRVVEIFGPESSGKTTLSLHAVANAQREGGTAAFIDAEHALDPAYAKKLGVDLDNLLVSQPDTGEQALEIAEVLVRSNAVDVIVIDSVAALVPKAEIEGEMGDSFVGLHARLMSQALRKLTAAISRSPCCMIFINQIREKIGVMFGSPETTTGGRALKFYSSVRVDIRRIGQIKSSSDEVIGNRTKATVVKNKIAPPFRKVEFDIIYNHGISWNGDLIDLGIVQGIVRKAGTWFSFRDPDQEGGADIRLGQGRERVRTFLQDNPDLAKKIEVGIRAKLGLLPESAPADSSTPSARAGTGAGDGGEAAIVPTPAGQRAVRKAREGDEEREPARGGARPRRAANGHS